MKSFKDIAYQVLKETGKPLHSKEITRLALKKGLVTEGKTPEATMNAQLIVDINKNKNESFFKKTAPSTYAINDHKNVTIKAPTLKVFIPNSNLSSKQKGDIAEARIAELIMLYSKNPQLSCYRPMSDDEGIDLIVKTKNGFKTMFIQVKSRFGIDPASIFTATAKSKTIVDNYSEAIVFCHFDLIKGDLWDYIWFVPAPDFIRLANKLDNGDRFGFVAGRKKNESNKWDQFLIEKQDLGNKIIDQMKRI